MNHFIAVSVLVPASKRVSIPGMGKYFNFLFKLNTGEGGEIKF